MRTTMKTFLAIWILITQAILISCSGSQNTKLVDIDDGYVNKQILMRVPTIFNSFNTNDPITLEVMNYSGNEINFPNNYNLRIFEQTADGWLEIKELPTIGTTEGDVVLSDTSEVEDLAVFPDLGDYSRSYKLRIYVIGDMQTTDEGSKKVAAYADVQLQP